MKLTEKKIQNFSASDYVKYRTEIKDFYNSRQARLKRLRERQKKFGNLFSQLSEYLTLKIKQVYYDINSRCYNSNCDNYSRYGGRGIKNFISKEDIVMLWFRDKAYLMQIPSIDRIDNDGNYEVDNCQFIELSENILKNSKKV
jgi:hypothetical protein